MLSAKVVATEARKEEEEEERGRGKKYVTFRFVRAACPRCWGFGVGFRLKLSL